MRSGNRHVGLPASVLPTCPLVLSLAGPESVWNQIIGKYSDISKHSDVHKCSVIGKLSNRVNECITGKYSHIFKNFDQISTYIFSPPTCICVARVELGFQATPIYRFLNPGSHWLDPPLCVRTWQCECYRDWQSLMKNRVVRNGCCYISINQHKTKTFSYPVKKMYGQPTGWSNMTS